MKSIHQGTFEDMHEMLSLGHIMTRYIFAYLKPFVADKNDEDENNFYMEREWRIVGNLKFSISDISTIFIPSSFARQLREDIPEFFGQIFFTD